MKKIAFLLLFTFALLTNKTSYAIKDASSLNINISEWSSLPILHEGRVKPIDSFARIYLKIFSTYETLNDESASQWLANSLFLPEEAIEHPLFKIRNYRDFNLSEKKKDLYSYVELAQLIQDQQEVIQELLKTNEEHWIPQQRSLMDLYQNFILYTQILRSMTPVLQLDAELSNQKSESETPKTYLDHLIHNQELNKKAKHIIKRKGENLDTYTPNEREIIGLSYQLQMIKKGGEKNVLLKLIQINDNENWLSLWETINNLEKRTAMLNTLKHWQNLAASYREQDIDQWHKTLKQLNIPTNNSKLSIERLYNQASLLTISAALYGVSLLLLILSQLISKQSLSRSAYLTLLVGALSHSIHITLRIFLLERPPVGTLYESIIFVSLICVFVGIFIEHKNRKTIGTLLGGLSGLLLLATANSFASQDTMSTLVAVLNTNFWLTTHVLCITIGYGWCLITSLLAHLCLIQKTLGLKPTEYLDFLKQNLNIIIILSLLFTIIGTILGGIWADQSWGRFWGWDPKENGALLIVLWIVWLLHSRLSKHLNDIAYQAGCAYLSVIVILAWFGVNLLSVGLHSYGFISGIAWGIGIFCAAETLIIGALWCSAHRKTQIK